MPYQTKNLSRFSEFPHVTHQHLDLMQTCMGICAACAKMCIEEGHSHTAVLCQECTDVCALAIKLHSSDSEFNQEVMNLCAHVCKRCAEECSEVNVEHCRQCSEICQECAEACRQS
jgi:hypothetical protein